MRTYPQAGDLTRCPRCRRTWSPLPSEVVKAPPDTSMRLFEQSKCARSTQEGNEAASKDGDWWEETNTERSATAKQLSRLDERKHLSVV